MEITALSLFALPIGLGLLGFVEPCTVGSHMIFLSSQKDASVIARRKSVALFIATRVLVTGLFGAAIAYLGHRVIWAQTGLWLGFGGLYLLIGAFFIFGLGRLVKKRITLVPTAWRATQNPVFLGVVFGLNIPACAAPILFGLLGVASSTGSAMTGFVMMALFGLALSVPLVPIMIWPRLANFMVRIADGLKTRGWIIGIVFILLGLWSIWFGLYVDPADWSGL